MANILVIDDEAGIRVGCQRVLEPKGYQVDTAETFAEGVQKINAGAYDLVLLDVMLPDGRGVDLLAPIVERDPDTVPIIITGYATVELAVEAIRQGAYDFISKPFTADVLRLTVRQGLEKRSLAIDARRTAHLEREAIQLTRQKEEAEELAAFKAKFTTLVAHELRSPVAGAKSLLSLLTGGYSGPVNDEQQDLLKRLEVRLNTLLDLINDLLDLAAARTADQVEQLKPVDLGLFLAQAADTFRESALHGDIQLTYSPLDGEVFVLASRDGLEKIFRNLIQNAIKYTPQGGRVSVTGRVEDGQVSVAVEDTGIGIPEESLSHIGEDFYRAPNAKTAGIKGTGLGLSIAFAQAQIYGGHIEVRSKVGVGTCITVHLPISPDQPA